MNIAGKYPNAKLMLFLTLCFFISCGTLPHNATPVRSEIGASALPFVVNQQDTPKVKKQTDAQLVANTNRAFGQLDKISKRVDDIALAVDKMAVAVSNQATSNKILSEQIADSRGISKKYKRKNDTLTAEKQNILSELKSIKTELHSLKTTPTAEERATWGMFEILITSCCLFTAITSGLDMGIRWFSKRVYPNKPIV
jgi:hypothetical protein